MSYEVVYLDRDGTINVDPGYLADPYAFTFCDGAVEGLKRLAAMKLDLVVVTNQSGVARGYFSVETVEAINDRMRSLLEAEGVVLAGIYYCPHGPDDGCTCRKPLPGMIERAEADLGRRPGVMIGDSPRDIEAGKARGLATIRIAEKTAPDAYDGAPDYIARDLEGAAKWVAEHIGASR